MVSVDAGATCRGFPTVPAGPCLRYRVPRRGELGARPLQNWWQYFGLPVAIIVAAWVITSVLGRVFGHWPTIWKAFAGVARTVWRWITHPVPLPVGLLVLAVVVVAWSWVTHPFPVPAILLAALIVLAACYLWAKSAVLSGRKNGARKRQPLSDIEHQILAVFAAADGRNLLVKDVSDALGTSTLEAQNALDKLVRRGLLGWASAWGGSLIYHLTQAGIAHVVDGGYLPSRRGRTATP